MSAERMRALWAHMGSVRLFDSRRSRACLAAARDGMAALALMAGLVIGLAPEDTAAPLELLQRRTVPPIAGAADTWLVMLYADAEDQLIEEDIVFGVNEAEWVGPTDQVKVVAQLDRCDGGYEEDQSTTLTQRYVIEKDPDLRALVSEPTGFLGELDMGSPQTIYDFATWAIGKYPSEHYVLIMADHGLGWYGGWSDDEAYSAGWLTLPGLDAALAAVVADTGIGAFELVGLDACLMSEVEVMSALAPHARYAVASEELSTSLGFSYASILRALTEDPSMSGRDLAEVAVESFIDDNLRFADAGLLAEWTGEEVTAQQVIDQVTADHTLAAIDLSKMLDVNTALNRLALALTRLDQALVAKARAYAQSYATLFPLADPNQIGPPSVVDLGSLVEMLLALTDDPEVSAAGEQVKEAVAEAVVAERHGPERPGSTGMAAYFPLSDDYEWTFLEAEDSYPRSVGRFAAASLWDDYLTYHYTGRPFEEKSADLSVLSASQGERDDFDGAAERSILSEEDVVVGPGAGQAEVSITTVSKEQVGPKGSVIVSAEVKGANIAEAYYFVSKYLQDEDEYLCAEAGYLDYPLVQTVGGLDLPDWGGGAPVPLEFEWLPVLRYLRGDKGDRDTLAFVDTYYPDAGDTEVGYVLTGAYEFVNTGDWLPAQLEFSGSGKLLGIWGYGPDTEFDVEHWHEILPVRGDAFYVHNDLVDSGYLDSRDPIDNSGDVFIFGDDQVRLITKAAEPGEYALCMGVDDMDGGIFWDYVTVTVTD